jgi:hypothetical protein
MEEKVLLPFAQKKRGGEPLPIAAKLRLDHGALAALLVQIKPWNSKFQSRSVSAGGLITLDAGISHRQRLMMIAEY